MIKPLLMMGTIAIMASCGNSKDEKTTGTETTTTEKSSSGDDTKSAKKSTPAGSSTISYTIEGNTKTESSSILVQKDKDKISPGNDYFGIITANGSGGETFVVNLVFSLKPGEYPVAGLSYSRDVTSASGEKKGQVFGGILGGKKEISQYKVNLTEVTNLGSNGNGGNKWKISGNIAGEVTINAMGLMKMDKEHPESIKVSNISFANLDFDDNWEEMMEKAMEKIKKD